MIRKSRSPGRTGDEGEGEGAAWDDQTEDEKLDPRRPEWPALRRKVEDYSPDPADWMPQYHMSATETSLRLARWLLAERLVASDISVSLTGLELTRRDNPRFPVERFLAERSVTRPEPAVDWRGWYLLRGASHGLRLHSDREEGDLVATLVDGRRLVAHVSRGVVGETRSSAEHKMLRAVIGRALTFEHAEPNDWGAAVVPRNTRFRQLAARWRGTQGMTRAGLLILTVDRVGTVGGFPAEVKSVLNTGRLPGAETEQASWNLS